MRCAESAECWAGPPRIWKSIRRGVDAAVHAARGWAVVCQRGTPCSIYITCVTGTVSHTYVVAFHYHYCVCVRVCCVVFIENLCK